MKKTQQLNNKASFKALINVQNQKIPQKKSRSRSVRDRNNTTNQFSVSIQHPQKSVIKQNQKDKRQNATGQGYNKAVNKFTSNSDNDNHSNMSRQVSSIEKIKQNMRKQSEQFKEKQRNRSHSRRRKSDNQSRNNSRQNSFNRFPEPINRQRQNLTTDRQSLSTGSKEQTVKQIQRFKNKVKEISKLQQQCFKRLSQNKEESSFNLQSLQPSIVIEDRYTELKERSTDLNNILQSFHINFKENLQATSKMLNFKIETIDQALSQNKNDTFCQKQQTKQKQNTTFQTMINRLNTEYSLQQCVNDNESLSANTSNNQAIGQFFSTISNNFQAKSFAELERKLHLAQQRLLK